MTDLKSRKKVEEAKEKEREETGGYIWQVRGAPGSLKVVRLLKETVDSTLSITDKFTIMHTNVDSLPAGC